MVFRWRWNFLPNRLFLETVNRLAGDQFVRMTFAKRPLRQRIVALAAAYAVALSGLMASLAGAQAAAEAIHPSEGILCHSSAAGQQEPASDRSDGKICADCCIGCLVTAATVPPQSLAVAPHSFSHRIAILTRLLLVASAEFNSYRSRGPPIAR